jgi:6,7-dimethyl-8-ribityllumazine synthase
MRSYESSSDATRLRFAVVVSRFNHLVSVRLLEGCLAELSRRGAAGEDVHVAWVPGAAPVRRKHGYGLQSCEMYN